MALSERRKRLRKALRAIGRRLKTIFSSAKLIIRRAITREVEYGTAVLREFGLAKMAELDSAIDDVATKGDAWLEDARQFLDEKAEEAHVKVELSDTDLLLIRQLLFKTYQEKKED